ncbi:MAG: hypothetical protein P1U89_18940 [Verrucomicrobiales bacterium]|nr:hypothetical protein [Verrucomicrobiales bacterium]
MRSFNSSCITSIRKPVQAVIISLACVGLPLQFLRSDEAPPVVGATGVLQPVTEENFSALKVNSPFRRSLNLSKSLILTGIARMEEDLLATLFDIESKEIHVVSNNVNANGWRLVEIKGNEADLESLTAQILITGGEVVSVRYEKDQLQAMRKKPESQRRSSSGRPTRSLSETAANYREGFRGDGFRGPPPPELVTKLSKLTNKQREVIIKKFSDLRNSGMSTEERQKLYVKEVDAALKGKR